jgi:hypothetical protein
LANDVASYSNLTIAAAETGSTLSWTLEKAESNADKRHTEMLAEKTDALNEKLNAKLEKSLEEKFSNQLNY